MANLGIYKAEPYSYGEARALTEKLGVSEPMAITLVRRGYRTPEQAQSFLAADESHEPRAFKSMGLAVNRILAGIRGGERITVHGDFDADGVCATAILVGALRELGADCDWLIPDRISDGYGLTAANVKLLAERGTSLLVTVDCGVVSAKEVALARSLDMDVIITDHHQPGDELPKCPVLHPALDGYPFEELCGTAVAWKLASALREAPGTQALDAIREAGDDAPALDSSADLDLVALATVADMVPLVGENRSLVRRGLEEVRRARRPGMKALMEVSSCEPAEVDEGDFAFRLAPRINAAGRLYRADAGVELFLATDEQRAAEIATELSRANSERRSTERKVDNEAEASRRAMPEEVRDAFALVVAGEGWHPGVIGIVASRLVRRHNRPTIVIALNEEGIGRGSGRSVPGFDLLEGLQACAEHLVRFGGHRGAAGLEIRAEDIDAFRQAFADHAASVLGPEDLLPTEQIDAMVGGASLGLDLAEELGQLAPFGLGNPGVRLLVPSARVSDVRTMGEGKHTRFSLHSGAHQALGVAFGRSSLGIGEEESVDAAVQLEVNRWNGAVEPRIVLRELYPYGDEAALPAEGDGGWWSRFEAELAADPTAWSPVEVAESGDPERQRIRSQSSPAAVIAELASCGERVLAVVADAERRSSLAKAGVRLVEEVDLEREPDLAAGSEHIVLVDPLCFQYAERLVDRCPAGGGYLHLAWGSAEWGVSMATLGTRFAQRPELIAVFRGLREAGRVQGAQLEEVLRSGGPRPRNPETAARCFRVLSELGLVEGTPNRDDGSVGVVSSVETDLERSTAYRAYSARYQEGRKFLEGRKQP